MLKFAAIGVISVPQNPDSIPIGGHDDDVAAESVDDRAAIRSPAVITGNAAKALPMIAVNTAMPIVYVATTTSGCVERNRRAR